MKKLEDFEENDEDFSLIDLYPKFVINSKGIIKDFDITYISRSINRETGLELETSEEIAKEVLRKIIGQGLKRVSTNYIREIVCLELVARGLEKHRNIYARYINISMTKFSLDESFVEEYKGKQPEWGPLGYITYKRTYARFIEKEDRKEEFWETLKRVVEGCFSIQKEHCVKLGLPWIEEKAQKSAQIMYEKMWNFKFIAPGRGLWIMGTPFIDRHGSMALNNCGYVSTDDIDIKGTIPFEWTMDALMLGVGVGFDTKGAGKIIIKKPKDEEFLFRIPDSREGWVEALKYVLEAYFFGNPIPIYDYSIIRPAGELIRGFGGIASGPKPLAKMIESIKDLLNKRIGDKLQSTDIVDIMNFIGKCVVAGNVRRSAEIALGDINDTEFITMKQDKEKLTSHRWASNNSIFAEIGMDYSFVAEQISKNGEPGVLWLENSRAYSRMLDPPDYKDKKVAGVNPCGEQSLESYELCCLVETFPSNHDSYEEFQDTLKYAYLYAKSVTLLNTHWKQTNAIMGKNRRIGTSQSGIINSFFKHGRRETLKWCQRGYKYLKELDSKYSDWLTTPKSIKMTSIKPSGSVSLLPGVTPGIHYPHSEYYIRRIRFNENSDLLPLLKDVGYQIHKDKYSPHTQVVEFPIQEDFFNRGKMDVSMWEQLENAAAYQRYWADNQVSITVTFKQKEAKDIKVALEMFEDKLKGVAFLPLNEHGYEQAPYEEITKEKYLEMKSKLKPLNLSTVKSEALGERFCDADFCEIKLK